MAAYEPIAAKHRDVSEKLTHRYDVIERIITAFSLVAELSSLVLYRTK